MENKIKDFFNKIADDWNNKDNNFGIINDLLNKIDIKPNSKVLDLACGKGIITPLLYERSKTKVLAIDLSDKMIDYAKIINNDKSKYEFICDDFISHNFNEKFDYIILFNAYPHFLEPEKLSEKIYNTLNNNGKFIIMHDISKKELNSHHQAKALKVSRYIDGPKDEYIYFKKYFKLKDYIDNDELYYMLLEI